MGEAVARGANARRGRLPSVRLVVPHKRCRSRRARAAGATSKVARHFQSVPDPGKRDLACREVHSTDAVRAARPWCPKTAKSIGLPYTYAAARARKRACPRPKPRAHGAARALTNAPAPGNGLGVPPGPQGGARQRAAARRVVGWAPVAIQARRRRRAGSDWAPVGAPGGGSRTRLRETIYQSGQGPQILLEKGRG